MSLSLRLFVIAGQAIRKLVKDGLVIKKNNNIHSRFRARQTAEAKSKGRQSGYGKRKGTAEARMPTKVSRESPAPARTGPRTRLGGWGGGAPRPAPWERARRHCAALPSRSGDEKRCSRVESLSRYRRCSGCAALVC